MCALRPTAVFTTEIAGVVPEYNFSALGTGMKLTDIDNEHKTRPTGRSRRVGVWSLTDAIQAKKR